MLKEAKRQAVILIKQNFLLAKPSTGEMHVSLNPRMLKEIIEEIK